MSEAFEGAERILTSTLGWLRLGTETAGALWVTVGAGYALVALVLAHLRGQTASFLPIRLTFSRYLSLALEFQLAADILSTAIAPTWVELGKLGVTAVIRTGLNYFLSREIREGMEEREREAAERTAPDLPGKASPREATIAGAG